jgi:1,4-dihydroxy-2-naphthoate octaprenyltransferase
MSIGNALFGVSRPPFLILPITLVAAGAAAAAYDGVLAWSRTLLALGGLVALHIAVNALNEASDMRTGIDLETNRTPFSGGSGTLPAGATTWQVAMTYGLVMAGIGALVGIWFVIEVGWVLLPVILIGAVAVLAYSDLFVKLTMGELFAGAGLGALPVLGTALVQDGSLGPAAVAASIPAFFMTFNLLLLNEFPDSKADRAGGRRHLVILLGRRGAALVYALAAVAVPAAILATVAVRVLPVYALVGLLPSLLLVGPLRWALGQPEAPVPVAALGANVAWNLGTNALLALGIGLGIWIG